MTQGNTGHPSRHGAWLFIIDVILTAVVVMFFSPLTPGKIKMTCGG